MDTPLFATDLCNARKCSLLYALVNFRLLCTTSERNAIVPAFCEYGFSGNLFLVLYPRPSKAMSAVFFVRRSLKFGPPFVRTCSPRRPNPKRGQRREPSKKWRRRRLSFRNWEPPSRRRTDGGKRGLAKKFPAGGERGGGQKVAPEPSLHKQSFLQQYAGRSETALNPAAASGRRHFFPFCAVPCLPLYLA